MIYGIDVKVIAAVIALFGVFLASVLSAGAYFYKVRVEAQKSTKKSLYYLLEIRYFILTSLFDPEKATEAYLEHYSEHLSAKGIRLTRQDFEDSLVDLIRGHFENIITTLKAKVENDLVQPYEESLLELATINPVLAYSLKGREKLGELLSQAKSYSESVPENINIPEGMEWLTDMMPDISTEMSGKAVEESLSQLEDDITALAKTCGRHTYKNTKEMLKKRLAFDDKDTFSELDSYMDHVIEKMIEAYKSSMPQEKSPEVA
jgi:hypothetical protein